MSYSTGSSDNSWTFTNDFADELERLRLKMEEAESRPADPNFHAMKTLKTLKMRLKPVFDELELVSTEKINRGRNGVFLKEVYLCKNGKSYSYQGDWELNVLRRKEDVQVFRLKQIPEPEAET